MNTIELNKLVFAYILGAIETEGYNITPTSDKEKLQFLADTFMVEHGYNIPRLGYQSAFTEWLRGAPSCFNVDFEYYEILKLAKAWGSLSRHATEAQEDKILRDWFPFIANKTMQLMKRHKVATNKHTISS